MGLFSRYHMIVSGRSRGVQKRQVHRTLPLNGHMLFIILHPPSHFLDPPLIVNFVQTWSIACGLQLDKYTFLGLSSPPPPPTPAPGIPVKIVRLCHMVHCMWTPIRPTYIYLGLTKPPGPQDIGDKKCNLNKVPVDKW